MSLITSEELITSPSQIELDQKCPKATYWRYLRRISGVGESRVASHGTDIHRDFQAIVEEKVLDPVDHGGETDQTTLEFDTHREGVAEAFRLYIWPLWKQEYDVVGTEMPVVLQRDGVSFKGIVDLLLRRKSNKKLVLKDYKTTGIMGKSWMDHWPYSIQMHIYLKAVEQMLGETPDYLNVVGVPTGEIKYGKRRHPYIYAYSNGSQWQSEYTAKEGWDLRPVWEYPGGVGAWVAKLGADIAYQQFPMSAPVTLDNRLLDQLITETGFRLKLMQRFKAGEVSIEEAFPGRYSQCRPAMGFGCEYCAACHNAVVNEDPVGSGLYVERSRR